MNKFRLSFLLVFLLAAGTVFGQAPANDLCSGAIDLTSFLGQGNGMEINAGTYSNNNATTDSLDPMTGWECFGEPDGSGTAPTLENTVWFTFVGDGSMYYMETADCGVADYIDDGDSQFALYTGMCNSLVDVMCNEDGPSATATEYPAGMSFMAEAGVTYYLMVDGFAFNGTPSDGEFCMMVTQQMTVTCDDSTLSSGMIAPVSPAICYGEPAVFDISGINSPNASPESGFTLVVSGDDISGSMNPAGEASFFGNYPIQNGIDTIMYAMLNDDSQLPSNGVYYFTPVVFGNATGSGSNAFPDLILDSACVYTGASQMYTFLPEFSAGTISADPERACLGDTVNFEVSDILGFNVGANSGIGFLTSLEADPDMDFQNDPTVVFYSGIDSMPDAPGSNMTSFVYDSTMGAGSIYVTPVLFVAGMAGTELETVDVSEGCVALGNSVMVVLESDTSDFCMGVGINGLPLGYDVSELFPVPTTSKVHVEFSSPNSTSVEVSIFDQLGRVVFSGNQGIASGVNNITFDVNTYSNGLYFVKIDHEHFSVTKKFVKE